MTAARLIGAVFFTGVVQLLVGSLQGEQLGTAGRRPVPLPPPPRLNNLGHAWRDHLAMRAPMLLEPASSGHEVGRLPVVLVQFSLQSPPQNLYDVSTADSLDRQDAGTTLLLIRSAGPLASSYVADGPQHPDVVTVYFCEAPSSCVENQAVAGAGTCHRVRVFSIALSTTRRCRMHAMMATFFGFWAASKRSYHARTTGL